MPEAGFLTELHVADLGDGEHERLLDPPLRFYSELFHGVFVVLPGFVSDGFSSPRLSWFWYPKRGGRYRRSAWVHDAAFQGQLYAETETGELVRVHLIEPYANDLFQEAMRCDQVKTAGFITRIVRWFGGSRYQGVPSS